MPTPIRIGMFSGISFVFALLYLADRWIKPTSSFVAGDAGASLWMGCF